MNQKQFLAGSGRFLAALFALVLGGMNCHALTLHVHLEADVSPPSTANDFHMRVEVTPPFALGLPIDFENGAFSSDGTTAFDATGFTVDWSGALVPGGGGPFTFGFDFTTNQPFTLAEAWWTLNGARIGNQNLAPLFDVEVTAVPEPSSMCLLLAGLGVALLLGAPRKRHLPATGTFSA